MATLSAAAVQSPPPPFSEGIRRWFRPMNPFRASAVARRNTSRSFGRKPSPYKRLRLSRKSKMPPDPGIKRFPLSDDVGGVVDKNLQKLDPSSGEESDDNGGGSCSSSVWTPDELEAISSLFERPMSRKSRKPPAGDRPLPLPLPSPYRTRPPEAFPTPKHHVRSASRSALSLRFTTSDRVRKNPEALIGLAREIAASDGDAREVLDRWSPFLRKGSLSLTVRELGHMGLPEKALQAFCWAAQQRLPELYPDDRILTATVEVLARAGWPNLEAAVTQEPFAAPPSSRVVVVEAMVKGFIEAGQLHRARELLSRAAKLECLTLDPRLHAKLILEYSSSRSPDGQKLASKLLDELAAREDFDRLGLLDCTAVMKACTKLGRFEAAERVFEWFKASSGDPPTVAMYTAVLHCRCRSGRLREGMALIREMEEGCCPLDLPAYRVVIMLCVAVGDMAKAARYLSRLCAAGFAPPYDVYREMVRAYAGSGRWAKCRELVKELEKAGMKLDKQTASLLAQAPPTVTLHK